MTRVTVLIIACVRHWTRLYTWRLPPAVRDARRLEIESDLWEGAHDPSMAKGEVVVQMLMRLALGIPDDLAWRRSQMAVNPSAGLRMATATLVAGVLLLWMMASGLRMKLPHPPAAPVGQVHLPADFPDPPPPPPAPGALPSRDLIFQYGRTSYSIVTDGPPPVRVKAVQPVYPPVALWGGLEGQVIVQATITERGLVKVAEAVPAGILGNSAINAIQRWEFAATGNEPQRPALLVVRVSFARSHQSP